MAKRPYSALAFLWARQRWAVLALGVALVLAAAFAVRLLVFTVYWSDPAHRAQPLEGWMTPGYIARSHDLDRVALRAALGVDAGNRDTLADIARARGVPVEDVIAEVEAELEKARGR
ncbi:hypothetical protein P6F26_06660 [Roseibacterium sp. SDUM158017]|uniref:hypothetical protein n=1 Tax=Roseicyclus salinarum TaxID=3036773 RepID=UPI00241548E8|nr:hypothetical protein [Roseibacterium sp. SDUM158017]MDG4648118.1 hypothetical protein [Roseibacterium sp. SDUM158017]